MNKFVYLIMRQGAIPYLELVEDCPLGVIINEDEGTWTYQGQTHEIGIFALHAHPTIGSPIGVFNPSNFEHLKGLLRSAKQFDDRFDVRPTAGD